MPNRGSSKRSVGYADLAARRNSRAGVHSRQPDSRQDIADTSQVTSERTAHNVRARPVQDQVGESRSPQSVKSRSLHDTGGSSKQLSKTFKDARKAACDLYQVWKDEYNGKRSANQSSNPPPGRDAGSPVTMASHSHHSPSVATSDTKEDLVETMLRLQRDVQGFDHGVNQQMGCDYAGSSKKKSKEANIKGASPPKDLTPHSRDSKPLATDGDHPHLSKSFRSARKAAGDLYQAWREECYEMQPAVPYRGGGPDFYRAFGQNVLGVAATPPEAEAKEDIAETVGQLQGDVQFIQGHLDAFYRALQHLMADKNKPTNATQLSRNVMAAKAAEVEMATVHSRKIQSELEQELAARKTECADMAFLLSETKRELKQKETEFVGAMDQVDTLSARERDLVSKCDQLTLKLEKLASTPRTDRTQDAEKEKLRESLEMSQQILKGKTKTCNDLEEQMKSVRKEKTKGEMKSKKELAQVKEEMEKIDEKLRDCDSKCSEMSIVLCETKNELTEKDQDLSKARGQIDALENREKDLASKCERLTAELDRLAAKPQEDPEKKRLEGFLAEVQRMLEEKSSECNDLEGRLANATARAAACEKKIVKLSEEHAQELVESQNESAQVKGELEKLDEAYQTCKAEGSDMSLLFTKTKEELTQKESELMVVKGEVNALSTRERDLDSKCDQLTLKLDELASAQRRDCAEKEELKESLDKLQREFEEKSQKCEELEAQLMSTAPPSAKLAESQDKLRMVQNDYRSMEAKVSDLTIDLEVAREHLLAKDERLKELENHRNVQEEELAEGSACIARLNEEVKSLLEERDVATDCATATAQDMNTNVRNGVEELLQHVLDLTNAKPVASNRAYTLEESSSSSSDCDEDKDEGETSLQQGDSGRSAKMQEALLYLISALAGFGFSDLETPLDSSEQNQYFVKIDSIISDIKVNIGKHLTRKDDLEKLAEEKSLRCAEIEEKYQDVLSQLSTVQSQKVELNPVKVGVENAAVEAIVSSPRQRARSQTFENTVFQERSSFTSTDNPINEDEDIEFSSSNESDDDEVKHSEGPGGSSNHRKESEITESIIAENEALKIKLCQVELELANTSRRLKEKEKELGKQSARELETIRRASVVYDSHSQKGFWQGKRGSKTINEDMQTLVNDLTNRYSELSIRYAEYRAEGDELRHALRKKELEFNTFKDRYAIPEAPENLSIWISFRIMLQKPGDKEKAISSSLVVGRDGIYIPQLRPRHFFDYKTIARFEVMENRFVFWALMSQSTKLAELHLYCNSIVSHAILSAISHAIKVKIGNDDMG